MRVSKFKLGLAMLHKEWNFTQLAEMSGVSKATLSAVNCGKSCKGEVVCKIAAALGVDPAELVEGV